MRPDFKYRYVSFMIGAILAATDPVSVVATLEKLGAPARVSVLIEGESLLNDGSAFVMFLVFLQAASGETQSSSEVASQLAQLTLGGPACGLAAGILLYFALRPAFLDPLLESGVILSSFWLLYYVADEIFGVSSVLGITTFGIFFAWKGRDILDHESFKHHTSVLAQVAYIANALIFIIAGAIIFNVFSGTFGDRAVDITEFALEWRNWGLLIALYIVLTIIR